MAKYEGEDFRAQIKALEAELGREATRCELCKAGIIRISCETCPPREVQLEKEERLRAVAEAEAKAAQERAKAKSRE